MNLRSITTAARTLRGVRQFSNALKYEPNKVSRLPAFEPKDTKSNDINWEKHNQKEWTTPMVNEAIDKHSLFPWIGNRALKASCINVSHADNIFLTDREGKKYMDWSAGAVCANLGHTVPEEVIEAVVKQLREVAYVYSDIASTDARAKLCSLLGEVFPGDLNGFYFASGGAEANEAAIRMARKYTGRSKIMTRYRSYHGATNTTIAATGDPRSWVAD